jgi:hypothetical protein
MSTATFLLEADVRHVPRTDNGHPSKDSQSSKTSMEQPKVIDFLACAGICGGGDGDTVLGGGGAVSEIRLPYGRITRTEHARHRH